MCVLGRGGWKKRLGGQLEWRWRWRWERALSAGLDVGFGPYLS